MADQQKAQPKQASRIENSAADKDAQALNAAVAALNRGETIAYPTEAVWGLGCDPDNPQALERLLTLKQRDPAKGMILIAGDIDQLDPWLAGITPSQRETLLASWPGPHTWLVPDNGRAHPLLRGEHSQVALRLSDHPLVARLCRAFRGPIVSTSANLAGGSPARTSAEVRAAFGQRVAVILEGELGRYPRPSTIHELTTGRILRP
ncbi:tRNA threonylcarbamoyladenosine biosynthesis protein RimN [Pistricoccus aurantiacus]|uniref:Threonylcarbamoyl-AMP synthase n=1 Tax=Pistricoccus aurantiacus TaxID=1883414 RepID=A0A5B8ST09_9GAMM|nr:Sua5/YciO/YrdC/YwlC family protein [Pistricoccus aurantiacus]QEA37808.1 tRNA threonylcarbamoyladenosine biosynthesis protein RimN [Pistricoccus aurantiacus]